MKYILLALIVGIICFVYFKYFKKIRCGNMICITGGIKTGKSMLAVRQSIQLVRSQRIKRWFSNNVFRYILYPFYAWGRHGKLAPLKPYPLLYSNIPLGVPYVPVTEELLRREEKPVQGSVCYLCEASLIADSMTYKDPLLNEELLLFNKLWGHASKGGYLVYDTQSILDNHYAVKRCLNSYIYIHHMVKGLFYCYMFLQEDRFSEDGTTGLSVTEGDVEDNLKLHIVPKSVWRKYDCYAYSYLTDDKPCADVSYQKVNKRFDQKAKTIVSFKTYLTLKGAKKK